VTDFQTYDSIRIGLDPRGNLGQLATSPSLAADLGAGRDDARAIFIDNHDVGRFVGRDTPDAATATRLEEAIVYLFTMPGTPVLYYGTEVALPGGPDPDDRRLMVWTGGNEDVRSLVIRLAHLRQATPSLQRGSFTEILTERSVVVYARTAPPGDSAVVLVNGDDERSVDVPLARFGMAGAAIRQTLGPGSRVSLDGGVLRVKLLSREATVVLVGQPPQSEIPAWSAFLLAIVALLAVGALRITLARRRSPRLV